MARKKRHTSGRPGRGSEPQRSEKPDSDYLWDALVENWPHILRMYRLCKHHGEIIVLYDIQEQRVYVYPYQEFKADLRESSRSPLQEQFEAATREGRFVVFIRDNDKRRLVSFTMDPE
jgi:hypothetical protein